MTAPATPGVASTPGNGRRDAAAARAVLERRPGGPGASAPERRVQGLAIAALVVAVGINAALLGFGPATLLGLEIPAPAVLALLASPLVAGIAGALQRSFLLVVATLGLLLLGALAAHPWEVTPGRFAAAAALGVSALAFAELSHFMKRAERWRAALREAGLPASGLDATLREYLRNLALALGLAAAVLASVGAVHVGVRGFGPDQLAASLDYRSVYGLAAAVIVVLGLLALVALSRGADFSVPRLARAHPARATPTATATDIEEVDRHG